MNPIVFGAFIWAVLSGAFGRAGILSLFVLVVLDAALGMFGVRLIDMRPSPVAENGLAMTIWFVLWGLFWLGGRLAGGGR